MNDDDLRDLLRPDPDGVAPLDPAKVIAGARRRRARTRTVAMAAASVMVAGAVMVVSQSMGTTQSSPPGATSTPRSVTDEAVSKAEKLCRAQIAVDAKQAPQARFPALSAPVVASHSIAEGTVVVFADDENWVACDTVTNRASGKAVVRTPGTIEDGQDASSAAMATAYTLIGLQGGEYPYYWAAGVLPVGVARIRYAFADGQQREVAVDGQYWILQYRSPAAGVGEAGPARAFQVTLFGADGSVKERRRIDPGLCPVITRGC
jgi:hypothetical protein